MQPLLLLAGSAAYLLAAGPASGQHKGQLTKLPSKAAAPAALAGGSSPLVGGGDSCGAPELIIGLGAFAFDLSTATTGPEGQSNALCTSFGQPGLGNDVWFVWSAPAAGSYLVSTCNQTMVDTKLAAYASASCPASIPPVACSDDACSLQSSVTVCATVGETFFFQLGVFPGSAPGAGFLVISPAGACEPNDSCSNPQPLGPFLGGIAFDNTLATTGPQAQSQALCNLFGTTQIANDLWYHWVAPGTGTATIRTCFQSTNVDTKLAVYSGATCPTGDALACSDDDCVSGAFKSSVTLPVVLGASYMVQLGMYPGSTPGPGSLAFDFAGPICQLDLSTYCTAMTSSSGCLPAMTSTGTSASLFEPWNFSAGAQALEANQNGLMFFGTTGPDSAPFFGGTLCVAAPLYRLSVKNTGGSAACSGALSYTLFEMLGQPGGGALLIPGQQVHCQVWTRDPPAPTSVSLSNGLRFTVCP